MSHDASPGPGKPTSTVDLLVLVIASVDQRTLYPNLQNIWRRYMHLRPGQVEAYFLWADPSLQVAAQINGDTIYARTDANTYIPGIFQKTILSLRLLLNRGSPKFKYALRTNLSSFFAWDRLLAKLPALPSQGCYAGRLMYYGLDNYISGADSLLSIDAAEILAQNESYFDSVNLGEGRAFDDVLIGKILAEKGINGTPLTCSEFYDFADWERRKNSLPKDFTHARVCCYADRERQDITIHTELLRMFYPEAYMP